MKEERNPKHYENREKKMKLHNQKGREGRITDEKPPLPYTSRRTTERGERRNREGRVSNNVRKS